MWIVAKIKKNNINEFKKNLSEKISDIKFYIPKILIEHKKNKIIRSEISVLEDYVFCYNQDFRHLGKKRSLNFIKGLKYYLNGCENYQSELINFIELCKTHENENGYIKPEFFDNSKFSKKKFVSGIFSDLIFDIVQKTNKKLKVLINGLKVTVENKNKYFYQTV